MPLHWLARQMADNGAPGIGLAVGGPHMVSERGASFAFRAPHAGVRDSGGDQREHRLSKARVAVAIVTATLPLILACALAFAAGDDEGLPSGPILEGRTVFEAKGCSQCHGILLEKGEQRPGPDLGRQRSWSDLMQLAGSLWNHTPAMLERMRVQGVTRAKLSPKEMEGLSAYLLYLNFLDTPGDAARGETLFETRSCARCHQLRGRGGTSGPRLDDLSPFASALFLAQALWNHGPGMLAKLAELGVERPRLEGRDVADLAAFIRGPDHAVVSPAEIANQLGSPRAGKALFESKGCIKCHAIDGQGSTRGPDLGAPRPMRQIDQMAGALWNHGPAMWADMKAMGLSFPRIDGPQMADLLAYLYFAQFLNVRGDKERGAGIFREKSCADCHAASDKGQRIGPDLSTTDAVRSPLAWASATWNHAPAMADRMRIEGKPWPTFADDEMRDLFTFLRRGEAHH